MKHGLFFALLTSLVGGSLASTVFTFDTDAQGWKPSQASTVLTWNPTGGYQNSGCLMIAATNTTSCVWLSPPLSFASNTVYRLTYRVRGEAVNGLVNSGTTFLNVDSHAQTNWVEYTRIIAAPNTPETRASIRLGQWESTGMLYFDDVRLTPVTPVYATTGDMTLGEGERMEHLAYSFQAPFLSECLSHSRPLHAFTAHYNSTRWCLGPNTVVTYDHALPNRTFQSAQLTVNCGYYASGSARIEWSGDGQTWQDVGAITSTGPVAVTLPPVVRFVRLRGEKRCSLQIYDYTFRAQLTGTPLTLIGSTHYVEVEQTRPDLNLAIQSLGSGLPGVPNVMTFAISNAQATRLDAQIRFTPTQQDLRTPPAPQQQRIALPAGATTLTIPYDSPGCGTWLMTVKINDFYTLRSTVTVPDFYESNYGECLPSHSENLTLWCASSGWKIPKARALPRAKTRRMTLSLARNEWEATQLVLTPKQTLRNVRFHIDGLKDLRVELLRVGYVPVTKATDKTGIATEWPDPLFPIAEPLTLNANVNHPIWIRVKAPKTSDAGSYTGKIIIEGEGLREEVPLKIIVHAFTLPDVMTCETAFGLGLHQVNRYHRLKDPQQQRDVAARYLRALSEHHISPYNPAPYDTWSATWKGQPPWTGTYSIEPSGALVVTDKSEKTCHCASYRDALPIPKKGVRIRFSYKMDSAQPGLFSFNHLRPDGSWISGHNTNIRLEPATTWQSFTHDSLHFPKEATQFRLNFWGAGYQEPGVAVGSLWIKELTLVDLDTGKELIASDALTPPDVNRMEPVFDWERWDAAMAYAFTNYHFNSFSMHVAGLGGGTFQSRYDPKFLGYDGSTPDYAILMKKYLGGIEAHLKEKGWLDKAYVYWFDEPDPKDYDFVMNGFKTLKNGAPGLRRMLTEQVEKDLIEGPNLWCPLTPSLNTPYTEARRSAGDQFWWYVCCGPHAPYITEFIDHPGIEMRLWLWQTWKERVSGILIWETTYWHSDAAYPDKTTLQNPYTDPMSWVSDATLTPGTRSPWGNGDGRFLYPPLATLDPHNKAPVLEDPIDSYRLELLRDGIDDYEYFAILKRLLAKKGAALSAKKRATYEALLTVPESITATMTTFTRDPRLLETHRAKLAAAIEALSDE